MARPKERKRKEINSRNEWLRDFQSLRERFEHNGKRQKEKQERQD